MFPSGSLQVHRTTLSQPPPIDPLRVAKDLCVKACPARRIKRGRGFHYGQPFSRCRPGFAPWMCRARTSRDVRVATARKIRRCPEGWARGIPGSCWRLICGLSRGSEHTPTRRPFLMTGATRDHSGRSDPNGKHLYSPSPRSRPIATAQDVCLSGLRFREAQAATRLICDLRS
jgi:hypothetical protein